MPTVELSQTMDKRQGKQGKQWKQGKQGEQWDEWSPDLEQDELSLEQEEWSPDLIRELKQLASKSTTGFLTIAELTSQIARFKLEQRQLGRGGTSSGSHEQRGLEQRQLGRGGTSSGSHEQRVLEQRGLEQDYDRNIRDAVVKSLEDQVYQLRMSLDKATKTSPTSNVGWRSWLKACCWCGS